MASPHGGVPMTRISKCTMALLLFPLTLGAQQQSPLPELPADIPKDAVVRMWLTDKTPSGQDAVWKSPDGTIHEFFQFNDRGRGPKIYTTYRLDQNGLIVSEESKGVDYMKSPVEERFSLVEGKAVWKNQAEDEQQADAAGKFYVDLNGGPESGAILARALLIAQENGKQLGVLPSGSATIRRLQSVPVEAGGVKQTVTLYEINGLAFTPTYIWLTEQNQLFASISGWSSLVRKGFESTAVTLKESQQKVENARAAELAQKLTHRPAGDLVIRNVSLFDSPSKSVLENQRVTVRGNKIGTIEPDPGTPAATGVTVIEGKGKMLLPGLWDMHAHLYEENA